MSGNSFGNLFKISTFGESHGPAIGVIIDGVPPNIKLTEKDIQKDLDRRRPGQSKITTQRKEPDTAEILSGVFEGKTTGAPLAILIRNTDQRSKDYGNIKNAFRPGHADYTYLTKYGIRDYRGGGRSSGRETACRVAAGAVAKQVLKQYKTKIIAYTQSVAEIQCETINFNVIEKNMVRAADSKKAKEMISLIEKARKDGDSVGGVVEAIVQNPPVGLGDPCFDKLQATLAHGLFSIATIKGLEFGQGFASTLMRGSEHNDQYMVKNKKVVTKQNLAGGIQGGISTGEEIVLRVAVKPPSSIVKPQESITKNLKKTTIQVKGRHDPCLCPRVVPVVEAMIAICLVDALLIQKSISS